MMGRGRPLIVLRDGIKTSARYIVVLWCLALIAFIGIGSFTKARPGTLNWGPVLDVWAITLAISNINFNLGGGLGYIEIYQTVKGRLSTSNNPFVFDQDKIVNPQLVDQAIKAGAAIGPGGVKKAVAEEGGYVLIYGDDVGYSDFYELAFRLFGFNAFATHYLYVSILAGSFLLLVVARWRCSVSLALGAILIGSIFLATNSALMSPSVPAVASNRFLTTLALVPVLHLTLTLLDRAPLTAAQMVGCAGQVVAMVIAIGARSSGAWTILAFVAVSAVVVILRHAAALRSGIGLMRNFLSGQTLTIAVNREGLGFRVLALGALLFVGVLFLSVRDLRLDRVYSSDAVAPHHVRWHSAYLGLVLHPEWPLYKAFEKQPNVVTDQVAWEYYGRYGRVHGLPMVSRITSGTYPGGLTPIRLHDEVIRRALFAFVANHPLYVFELMTYYKPRVWVGIFGQIVGFISVYAYVSFVPFLLFAWFVFFGRGDKRVDVSEIYAALLVMWAFSLLPSLFAYPTLLAMGDNFAASIFLISSVFASANPSVAMWVQGFKRVRGVWMTGGGIVIFVLCVWLGSWLYDEGKRAIRIVDVTYTSACTRADIAMSGGTLPLRNEDAADFVSLACNGKIGKCSVPIEFRTGESSCEKGLEVRWRCGTGHAVGETRVVGLSGTQRLSLSCKR